MVYRFIVVSASSFRLHSFLAFEDLYSKEGNIVVDLMIGNTSFIILGGWVLVDWFVLLSFF